MVTVYFLKGVNIAQMKEIEEEKVEEFLHRYYSDLRYRSKFDGFHLIGMKTINLELLKRSSRFGELINPLPEWCLI